MIDSWVTEEEVDKAEIIGPVKTGLEIVCQGLPQN